MLLVAAVGVGVAGGGVAVGVTVGVAALTPIVRLEKLLPGVPSGSAKETPARLVSWPRKPAFTTIRRLTATVVPNGKSPSAQVSVPPTGAGQTSPRLDVALTHVTPEGSVSVSTTLRATEGPTFRIVSVKVSGSLGAIVMRLAVWVSVRSGSVSALGADESIAMPRGMLPLNWSSVAPPVQDEKRSSSHVLGDR